jgi:hypothetical protein
MLANGRWDLIRYLKGCNEYSLRYSHFLGSSTERITLYLTAIGLTPGGSSTVQIYTQIIHRIQRTEHT